MLGPGGDGEKFIAGVDIGTTFIRCILFNVDGQVRGSAFREVPVLYPKPSYSEIDPLKIWQLFKDVVLDSIKDGQIEPSQVSAMGVSVQRNTFLLWNSETGIPLCNLVTWQDQRAADFCKELNESWKIKLLNGIGSLLFMVTRSKRFLAAKVFQFMTGMVITRLKYMLEHYEHVKEVLERGELSYGCLETWLLRQLTGEQDAITETSVASATGMWDPFLKEWGSSILNFFQVPISILPRVEKTDSRFGCTKQSIFGHEIPIRAIMSDTSASMFGCGCFEAGSVKITQGTGTFVDMNTLQSPHTSLKGIAPTVLWDLREAEFCYSAMAFAYDTGTAIDWAKEIGLYENVAQTSDIAVSVEDTDGVYFVPSFHGLQAPINDNFACCSFMGLKATTRSAHLVRSILESLAFRAYQIIQTLEMEAEFPIKVIRVNGGVSQNDFLCQMITDLVGKPIERMKEIEASAFGVAAVAGLAVDFWADQKEISRLISIERTFYPCKDRTAVLDAYSGWSRAVERSLRWYF